MHDLIAPAMPHDIAAALHHEIAALLFERGLRGEARYTASLRIDLTDDFGQDTMTFTSAPTKVAL